MRALAAAGLFRALVPKYLGGGETDLMTLALAVEEVAKADGSTAWCVGQGAGSGMNAVWLEPAAAAGIWGDPRGIVARGPGSGTALEAFVALAGTKTPRLGTTVLRESALVRTQMGHVEAELRSARAFLHLAIERAWRSAERTRSLSLEERVDLRLATTHAIRAGARAVDTIYHAAGATAIFTSNPFERRFRDVNAVTQQIQASELHFETAGRFFLGLHTPLWSL